MPVAERTPWALHCGVWVTDYLLPGYCPAAQVEAGNGLWHFAVHPVGGSLALLAAGMVLLPGEPGRLLAIALATQVLDSVPADVAPCLEPA